jgi:hypothetical protein
MEAYRIYLRAFITSAATDATTTDAATVTTFAAIALAVHDAMHGRKPRSADDVVSAVERMLKEPTPCA